MKSRFLYFSRMSILSYSRRILCFILLMSLILSLFPTTLFNVSALTSNDLSISDNGINFICSLEGFHATCYPDTTQSSIGYGTKCTGSSEQPHTAGLHSITQSDALAAMKSQINSTYAPKVRKQTSGITMNQNQFDALVSLCYQTGGGTTIISNSPLVKYLKGQLTENEARTQYSNYIVTSGGKVLQGIINRRNKEANLFFSGNTVTPVLKKPEINLTAYPTTLVKGSKFNLTGTVTANGASTTVTGYVINSSNGATVMSTTSQTTASSLDIKNSNVNNQLRFGQLDVGEYLLRITATNSCGTTTVEKEFEVVYVAVSVEDITVKCKQDEWVVPKVITNEKYSITYKSSSPGVATVDADGHVITKLPGTAKIRCTVTTASGKEASCSFKVKSTIEWWKWILIIITGGIFLPFV